MYVEVILREHSRSEGGYTYIVPPSLEAEMAVGKLVIAPWRGRPVTGIVAGITSEKPAYAVQSVQEIRHDVEVEGWQLELAQRVGAYYFASPHQVWKLFFPEGVWRGKYTLRQEFLVNPLVTEARGSKQQAVLNYLQIHGPTKLHLLTAATQTTSPYLQQMAEKQLIKLDKIGLKTVIKEEASQGIFRTLSPAQRHCFETIRQTPGGRFLLHGVAGSGKTEIYLQLAYHYLQHNQAVIILVPEVGLTTGLIDYFRAVFGEQLAILHSHLSEGERTQEWWRIRLGEAKIILGSRIALFAPVPAGLIVLDEEHEWTYKSEQAPRYHAREVAMILNELTKATVLLASATPAIETYYRAQQGELTLLELPRPYFEEERSKKKEE